MDDLKLVVAATRGDKDAFLKVLLPLEKRLYQSGLGIVGNFHDAQDVWQNTVLQAWRNIHKLREPQSFRTWITRIVLNEARAVLRQRRNQPIPIENLPELEAESANYEELLVVHKCLQKLPAEHREAVLLRYWIDMPLAEIAQALEIPLSTAKTRVYQGLRTLRELMKEVDVG